MIKEETVPTVRRRRQTFPEAFKREAAERAETSGRTSRQRTLAFRRSAIS
jgi:hypothetical protein